MNSLEKRCRVCAATMAPRVLAAAAGIIIWYLPTISLAAGEATTKGAEVSRRQAAAFWLVRPDQTDPKILQWAEKYPKLVSLIEQNTYGGHTAYVVTVTDPQIDAKAKKKLLFSQPHAHEPAATAGMMDFLSQVLDGVHLDGQKSALAYENLLQKVVLTLIPDGNPDGRARVPEDWWDGSKYANDDFGKIMFGRRKDGSACPRLGRWSIRDIQPEFIGIAYEQINNDEYVEPNRDPRVNLLQTPDTHAGEV